MLCSQTSPSLEELHRLSYTKAARGRARVQSALPSSEEAEALFQLDADQFTPEAVEGMRECVSHDRLMDLAHQPASLVNTRPSSAHSMACNACRLSAGCSHAVSACSKARHNHGSDAAASG